MDNGMVVRVLGPIDVMTPDGVVSVGGNRVRALLGALVIAAGRAVSIDHLQQVLWGDDPPRSADSTLQSYVSCIRHVLGAEVIVRTDHSYELDATSVEIDALQFERLLRTATEVRADPLESGRLAQEALGLWRGRPFGDLADDEAFNLEAYRLDELRLAAMELGIESDLALGRQELVVSELESAVEEHPYRERLWLLLIQALALSDRRVEALRACTRLRRILGDVGIEIGGEISALERRILDGEAVDTS
jgi:DNA-binding SARP family transcriptional activator